MNATAPFLHLSIDDVFDCLIEASDRGTPLADNPMMAALDALHREFGMPVDLYLFCEAAKDGDRRRIEEFSPALASELRARPWLRLGPHALDDDTPPYTQAIEDMTATLRRCLDAIERLVGPAQTSRWIRLHHFSECYESAALLRARGIDALLTTDKPAIAYRLPPAARAVLEGRGRVRHRQIDFVRSHVRIERFAAAGAGLGSLRDAIRAAVEGHGFVSIFSHEVCFADPRTRETLREALAICRALGLSLR